MALPEASQGIASDDLTPAAPSEYAMAPNLELRLEFSPTMGALFGALAKAHKAFKPVVKSSINPFFKSKYADLAEVLAATVDGLSDNGLAIVQPPCYRRSDGTVEIHTVMGHSSGEWAHSILEMPVLKMDAQAVGSAITYGRRYAYSGMVNVASEMDDDGSEAVSKPFKGKGKEEESPEDFDQRTVDQQCISAYQVAGIADACKRSGKTDAEVEAYLGLIHHKQVKELLKSEFTEFLKWANTKSAPKLPLGMKPASQIDSPTQKAMKRVFALAGEYKIPEGDVKEAAYSMFSVKSMTELSVMQLDEMVKWVKGVAEAVSES